MSLTLVDGATTITLPADMHWSDEYAWLPTAQQTEVAFDGALIVQESAQLAGRPVTLEGGVTFAWIDRATLESLRTLASTPRDMPMVLTLLDGRAFNVLFRHGATPAVDAKPILDIVPFADGDAYALTLRLLQV